MIPFLCSPTEGQSQSHTTRAHSESTQPKCKCVHPVALSPSSFSQSCHFQPFPFFLSFQLHPTFLAMYYLLRRLKTSVLSVYFLPPLGWSSLLLPPNCLKCRFFPPFHMCSSATSPVSIRTLIPIIPTLSLSLFALPSNLLFKKHAVSKLSIFHDQTPRRADSTYRLARKPSNPLPSPTSTVLKRSQVLSTTTSNSFSWPASFLTLPWHLHSTQSKLNWVVLSFPVPTTADCFLIFLSLSQNLLVIISSI